MTDIGPKQVLDFWFKETPSERWFRADPAFDAEIRSRFDDVWRKGCAGELAHWADEKDGDFALVLLFDQFPRNMFCGTAAAFSSDALARDIAKRAIAKGHDLELPVSIRYFFYLPLMHSEDLADQETSVRLVRERLGEKHLSYPYALSHRAAIERFGRFPARNAALGRASTESELEFLKSHPAGF